MRLNETQEQILKDAEAEALKVAQRDARAEEAFKAQKELNREELKRIARDAASARVPIRQFGLAIGTSDFKTVKEMYDNPNAHH